MVSVPARAAILLPCGSSHREMDIGPEAAELARRVDSAEVMEFEGAVVVAYDVSRAVS